MKQLKENEVLVEGSDHTYEVATIRKTKVTWCEASKTFFEYAGDEYVEDDEIVVEMNVAG